MQGSDAQFETIVFVRSSNILSELPFVKVSGVKAHKRGQEPVAGLFCADREHVEGTKADGSHVLCWRSQGRGLISQYGASAEGSRDR